VPARAPSRRPAIGSSCARENEGRRTKPTTDRRLATNAMCTGEPESQTASTESDGAQQRVHANVALNLSVACGARTLAPARQAALSIFAWKVACDVITLSTGFRPEPA
jgi:hypothetical protein